MTVLSRNHIHDSLVNLTAEIEDRYEKARAGYSFDFKEDIEPFLNRNKLLVEKIKAFDTDTRFTPQTREKLYDELMEMLMSCHISRFSLKLYHEKIKYINVWIDHAARESLI